MERIVSLVALLRALTPGAMSPGRSFVLVARTAIARSRSDALAAALSIGVGGVLRRRSRLVRDRRSRAVVGLPACGLFALQDHG